jgi:hypothetical protein
VWEGWRLRVTSATPRAIHLFGPDRERIPPGGQEFMVSIAATYGGGGYAPIRELTSRLYADGSHSVFYTPDAGDYNCAKSTAPRPRRPLNETRALVFPGRTLKGHLCFLIAENDARSLVLYVDKPGCRTLKKYDDCTQRVWFALRP